jgi:hypothetical protein
MSVEIHTQEKDGQLIRCKWPSSRSFNVAGSHPLQCVELVNIEPSLEH